MWSQMTVNAGITGTYVCKSLNKTLVVSETLETVGVKMLPL